MQNVTTLHRDAMEFADKAELARLRGDLAAARQFSLQAFENERAAAQQLASDFQLEPTRSVLHRSAATLALDCGKTREAERLIAAALAGDPPNEIAEELRDLLEDVHLQRHLELRGVSLQRNEFQMSMEGAGVGFGVAPTDSVISRVKDLEAILYRTAERKLGRQFREAGRRQKTLENSVSLYMSVPRAASFAVTFRLGNNTQLPLPGMDFTRKVIDDVLDCLEFLTNGDTDALRERIPDESYFKNFLGLAKKIAPDGNEIRTVGFTAAGVAGERKIALSSNRSHMLSRAQTPQLLDSGSLIEIRGVLLSADARGTQTGRVVIIDKEQKAHKLTVPRGMMSDIVKPMFEEEVYVIARQMKRDIVLEDIELARE